MTGVLWLHDMGAPSQRRASVVAFENLLRTVPTTLQPVIADVATASRTWLRAHPWNLIVLGPTFLANRTSELEFKRSRDDFDWVASSTAIKVALPQDEYDCSALLDDWLTEWSVDVCYSIFPEFATTLYPRFTKIGEVRQGHTVYLDNQLVQAGMLAKRPVERRWDVVYRANRLPANFGSLGALKWRIGEDFTRALQGYGNPLAINISSQSKDTVFGRDWWRLLGDSRFTLATPSGSSVLDVDGSIRRCVLVESQAGTSDYRELAERCFPNLDSHYRFEALAPRHVEAALTGTVQLAVPGNYSGVLEKDTHYIPLHPRVENIDEVLHAMSDETYTARVRQSALEAVLSCRDLRASEFVTSLEMLCQSRGGPAMPAPRGHSVSSLRVAQVRLDMYSWLKWTIMRTARRVHVGLVQIPGALGLASRLRRTLRRHTGKGGHF